jgi:hypothetical protein
MFESEPGHADDFHGYLRVGGMQYQFTACSEDNWWGGKRRWVLKLTPHSPRDTQPPEAA